MNKQRNKQKSLPRCCCTTRHANNDAGATVIVIPNCGGGGYVPVSPLTVPAATALTFTMSAAVTRLLQRAGLFGQLIKAASTSRRLGLNGSTNVIKALLPRM
jgi:hypothetical protein